MRLNPCLLWLLTQMILFLVLESGKPGLEVLVTEGAFERSVLRVQDHVLLQMRPAGESLQTNLEAEMEVTLKHHKHARSHCTRS